MRAAIVVDMRCGVRVDRLGNTAACKNTCGMAKPAQNKAGLKKHFQSQNKGRQGREQESVVCCVDAYRAGGRSATTVQEQNKG